MFAFGGVGLKGHNFHDRGGREARGSERFHYRGVGSKQVRRLAPRAEDVCQIGNASRAVTGTCC